jgi:2-dehydro-3-deoxygluconokinase
LNYRAKLWNIWGGETRAQSIIRRIVENVDVLVGNEEDLQLGLGIPGPNVTAKSKLDPAVFIGMIDNVLEKYPKIKVVATTLREVHSTNRHSWAAVAWMNGQIHLSPTAELDVYDRVGAGWVCCRLFYGLLTARNHSRLSTWAGARCSTDHFPGDTHGNPEQVGRLLRAALRQNSG